MAAIERRTRSDGKIMFRVKVRLKGFPLQTASFDRLTDARKWAQITEAAMREGRHFKTAEAKKHTLGDLIDRYLQEVMPTKPKSRATQTTQLNWWKNQAGHYLLADVTPALIVEYRQRLSTESMASKSKKPNSTKPSKIRSPASVVRYMAALSHVFSVAVREWGWVDASPMSKVSKPKEPRGRVRFLSEKEREDLLAACMESACPYLYPVVFLAIATGMRRGEIMGLRWHQVDFLHQRIILHETKNGERRAVPLSVHVLELLRNMSKVRRIGTDLLFPGRNLARPCELKKPWQKAVTKAKINDFRFHDLRHSAASYLAMNGASLAEIAEILGHKTLAMVKRYAHLSEAHTASVVADMNEKIFAYKG